MNLKVKLGNNGIITLTDRHYLAAGGEAKIYINGGKAFKIYHDENKVLPLKKMEELSLIKNPQVVIPQDILYDASTGHPIGYTTKYIDNAEPLLKLFTKTFKTDNNISHPMIVDLVKQLQLITTDIHNAKCLIVDFNELNVLVNIENVLIPWFIDVDSYKAPNFHSTAVMDSIRDRRVSKIINGVLHYYPDELSDWFSWAVLAFQLYTNIHPYRGNHPKYKPKDKVKQMDDGISIFHKNVKIPPCAGDPKLFIPPRQLPWFEAVFGRNERSIPPLADSVMPLTVPAPIINITGNKDIEITQTDSYSENVLTVVESMGLKYVITNKKIYCNGKEYYSGCDRYKKVLLCPSNDGTMVMAILFNGIATFIDLIRQQTVGTMSANGMFYRNKSIYTVYGDKLVENKFTTTGNRIFHRITELENVSTLSTVVYDGCAIQNLLGKYYLILPYQQGACFSKYLPQLDGYRIVDCRAERNVAVVIGERGGKYDRFIIVFTKKDFTEFNVRVCADIAYDGINFTTTEKGLTLLLASPDELELFANNTNIQAIQNPPFDSSMKLFNTSEGVFFTNGTTIHRVKRCH